MIHPWKRHERRTAKKLGGERNKRGADFSQSLPDVDQDMFTIECKYRKKLSGFLIDGLKQAKGYDKEKIPLLVLKQKNMRGELVVMRLDDLLKALRLFS